MKIFQFKLTPNANKKVLMIKNCLKNNFQKCDYTFSCQKPRLAGLSLTGDFDVDEENVKIVFNTIELYNLFMILIDEYCLINEENSLIIHIQMKESKKYFFTRRQWVLDEL